MSVNKNEVPRHITVIIAGAFDFTLNAAQSPQRISEISGIQTMKPAQLKSTAGNTSADGTAGIATRDEKTESVSIIRVTPQTHQHQAYYFVGATARQAQVRALLRQRQR
jgi:hypothetical protein